MQGLTIAEAARSLGVSSRTIRRFIKSGKISAELVPGPFGEEYHILELPDQISRKKPVEDTLGQDHRQTSSQDHSQAPGQYLDIIRELQEKNLALAAQLGVTSERIRVLESQVKLLTTTKQSWWKRLFSKKG